MGRNASSDRVAVTGLGFVTPLGHGRERVWQGLLDGTSGIGPVRSFDTAAYAASLGAEVHDFDPAAWVERLDPAHLGRASSFAIAAARQALEDAAFDPGRFADAGSGSGPRLASERVAVVMGTTSGEPLEVERFNDRLVEDRLDLLRGEIVTRYPCHVIAGHVAAELGFGGPNVMIPAACAAGNYAVGHAFDLLRSGRADMVLAGGADAFSRITYAGFARLGAIAPERCQPFDKNRRGMVPGEGAAVLVLEPVDAARARGARIYAEVAGYGLSCDAHHMTAAHPAGAARAMTQALRTARMEPEEIDYISAHGTGTPTNDRQETLAVRRVFGDARARSTAMSSIKSMLGHTMGAASAIEAGVCALAVARQTVPPTIGFETPDPQCDVDCVPNEARAMPVRAAMNNAYAFGGNNASVIFRPCAH